MLISQLHHTRIQIAFTQIDKKVMKILKHMLHVPSLSLILSFLHYMSNLKVFFEARGEGMTFLF